jgi:hypothetical protein
MTAKMETEPFERVLVALDASGDSLAALDVAAGLAYSLNLELGGLFVEDQELLDLAELPFAAAVSLLSGRTQRLEREAVVREMSARAHQAERAVAAVAERRRLKWRFDVRRERVGAALRQSARGRVLLCVGRGAGADAVFRRLGRSARTAASLEAAVLYADRRARAGASGVAVIHDGKSDADAAFDFAVGLARAREDALIVLISGPNPDAVAVTQDSLRGRLPKDAPEVEFTPLVGAGAEMLITALRAAGVGILIGHIASLPADRDEIQKLIAAADCPVLLFGAREL